MSKELVQIETESGEFTPFSFEQNLLSNAQLDALRSKINLAKKAPKNDFKDIASVYWIAQKGEEKFLAFKEWEIGNKKDDKGNIIGKKLLAVMFDGQRDVVMAQVSIIDNMKSANSGDVFRIKCIEAASMKAKIFEVELFAPAEKAQEVA